MGLTPDELQKMTWHLCFNCNRACNPVSKPAPAHYATLMASRARAHLSHTFRNAPETREEQLGQGGRGGRGRGRSRGRGRGRGGAQVSRRQREETHAQEQVELLMKKGQMPLLPQKMIFNIFYC